MIRYWRLFFARKGHKMDMSKINLFVGSLGGRKFLLAVLGVVLLLAHGPLGIPMDTLIPILKWLGVYILGQAASDAFSGGATSTVAAAVAEAKVVRAFKRDKGIQ